MQNAAVADMFDEIADLLEIAGENPFQVRAYRRAAEAISSHVAPVEDLSPAELRAIPGLGPATTDKTKEFLATGSVSVLEKLREAYPRTMLELMRVPGLGPKKVAQLYRERGIGSVEALQEALANGELNGLAGFGPKTQANVLEGIRRLGEMSAQLPLLDAVPLADLIARTLGDVEGVEQALVAGPVRRGCETVSALDWVVQTDDAEPVLDAFTALPQVVEVQERDALHARVKLRPGLDATVWATPRAGLGGALMLATGSAPHIEEGSRRMAERGVDFAFEREEELYAALGVDFIEPEMREGGDEWTLGQGLQLVQQADIRGDLHAHSTWSDGTASIREMVETALSRGYVYHAVTDHSRALAMANGLDAARLREQAIEIAEVQEQYPDIKIFRGIECDIMRDGTMDLDDETLHSLDWVIGSVHSAFSLDEAAQTKRIVRAIENPAVDMIAHPTGRILGRRPAYAVDVAALVEAARDSGTALEINASERLDLKDEHARMARDAGVLISIDTDAHKPRAMANIHIGILTARRAWCETKNILNTKSVAELTEWLQRPR